jgi:hypothetical protein
MTVAASRLSRHQRTYTMKTTKNCEIPSVQRQDGVDSRVSIGRSQQRVEQALATKPICPQPLKKQSGALLRRENRVDFAGSPPSFGQAQSLIHSKRVSKAPFIRGNVHELRENLRSKREAVASPDHSRQPGPNRRMVGTLGHLCRNEKTRVDAVIHCRPSSSSSKRSSSDEKGRRISPTLTAGISRTLCSKTPSMAWRARARRCCSNANSAAFSLGIAASISSSVLISPYFATNLFGRKGKWSPGVGMHNLINPAPSPSLKIPLIW